MGRKAGVTAEETRAELLAAAARVFGEAGYDGASLAAITAEAGLSTGSVYVHFSSKAELFVAAMEAHGTGQLEALLGPVEAMDAAEYSLLTASLIDRRDPNDVSLLVEAIVASKRDADVAELIRPLFAAREQGFADLIRAGQAEHVVSDAVTADALARMATMLALGSLLTGAVGLPDVDHDEWANLMGQLVDSFRAEPPAARSKAKDGS